MLLEKLVNDNYIDIEQENLQMIENLILGNRSSSKYADFGNIVGHFLMLKNGFLTLWPTRETPSMWISTIT